MYSQRQEGTEYLEYIDYLQTAGYLKAETEDVELEDLQGARGLKALPVMVDTPASRTQNQVLPEIAATAVKALPKIADMPSWVSTKCIKLIKSFLIILWHCRLTLATPGDSRP